MYAALIITEAAFTNAANGVSATARLHECRPHLLAIAREAGVTFEIDEFDHASRTTPVIADLKPGGRFFAADMYEAGGTRLVGKRMMDAGKLKDCPTVSGRSLFTELKKPKKPPASRSFSASRNP